MLAPAPDATRTTRAATAAAHIVRIIVPLPQRRALLTVRPGARGALSVPALVLEMRRGFKSRVPRARSPPYGLTNLSTKRSLVPRRSAATRGESFQSRGSSGLRRKDA